MAPRRAAAATNNETSNVIQSLVERVNQLTNELRILRGTRGQDEQSIEESRTVAESGGILGYNSNRPLYLLRNKHSIFYSHPWTVI